MLYSPQDFDADMEGVSQYESDGSILPQAIQRRSGKTYFDM
jgi:hypothetical protein